VHPLHAVVNGQCSCGGGPKCKPGKHPAGHINPRGSTTATTDRATIEQWWALFPDANIGICAEKSGLLIVGPDSDTFHEDFKKRGLPETLVVQSGSGNHHYYFRRPADAPVHRECRSEKYDIISSGNLVGPGSMALGPYIPLTTLRAVSELPEAPAWSVAMLRHSAERKAAAEALPVTDCSDPPVRLSAKAMEWWIGERYVSHSKKAVDRDKTLYAIAKELCKANANVHTTAAAIAERDQTFGATWPDGPVYAGRKSANDYYIRTARRAMAAALNEPEPPTFTITPVEQPDVVTIIETDVDANQRIRELERKVHRLEQVVNFYNLQWQVIANPELSATQKIVGMATLNLIQFAPRQKLDDQGRLPTWRTQIARKAGVTEETVSRTLKKGPLADIGVFEIDVEKVKIEKVNPETGEIYELPTQQWFIKTTAPPADALENMRRYVKPEDAPKHGGKRTKTVRTNAPAVCSDHPDAGMHWIGYCLECEKDVDQYWVLPETDEAIERRHEQVKDLKNPPTFTHSPSQQVVAMEPAPATVVSPLTPQVVATGNRSPLQQDAATVQVPQRRWKPYPDEVWNPHLHGAGGTDD
jgi:hypothetical protein